MSQITVYVTDYNIHHRL